MQHKEEPTSPWWKKLAIKVGTGIGCMAISSAIGYYLGLAVCTKAGAERGSFMGGIAGFVLGAFVVGPILSTIGLAGSALWGVTRGFDTITTLWGNTFNILMRAATGEKLSAKGVAMLLTGSLPDVQTSAPVSTLGKMATFFSNSWDQITGKGLSLEARAAQAEAMRQTREYTSHTAELYSSGDPEKQREAEARILGESSIGGVEDLNPTFSNFVEIRNETAMPETENEFKRRVQEHEKNKTPIYEKYNAWFEMQTTTGLKSFEQWLKQYEAQDTVKPTASTSYAQMFKNAFTARFLSSPKQTSVPINTEDKVASKPFYSSPSAAQQNDLPPSNPNRPKKGKI